MATGRVAKPVNLTNIIFGKVYDPAQMARLMQQINLLASGFNASLAQQLAASKAADTSVTVTPLAADPDLYVALPGAGIYLLRGLAYFTSAGGIILGMTTSNSGNTGNAQFVFSRQVAAETGIVAALAMGATLTDTTVGTGAAEITGSVIATGPTTISLSWASATAADTATMKAGSALIAQLVG